jgi:hypothetical protein
MNPPPSVEAKASTSLTVCPVTTMPPVALIEAPLAMSSVLLFCAVAIATGLPTASAPMPKLSTVELMSMRELVSSSTVAASSDAPAFTFRFVVTVADVVALELSTETRPPLSDDVLAVTSASPDGASLSASAPPSPENCPPEPPVRSWTRRNVPAATPVRSMPSWRNTCPEPSIVRLTGRSGSKSLPFRMKAVRLVAKSTGVPHDGEAQSWYESASTNLTKYTWPSTRPASGPSKTLVSVWTALPVSLGSTVPNDASM